MSARTRIAVVSATLCDGGAERFASTLLQHLDRRRFAPSLVLLREHICYPLPHDVTLRTLGHRGLASIGRTTRRLRRLLAAEDVVLSCGSYTSLFVGEALRTPAPAPTPRWVARVGDDPDRHPESRCWRALQNARLARSYARAVRVVANSHSLAAALQRRFPAATDRVCTLANPVDIDGLETRAARVHAGDTPAAAGVRTRLLSLGRLHAQKRPLLLLDAFSRLASIDDVELWYCGDGPLRRPLEREIARRGIGGRVRVLGFHADPVPLLAAADIVVSASAHEGMPNALIEAQALGLPVVATRCDHGVDEIVTPDTGRLVDDASPAAIASAIDDLVTDTTARAALGKRAREHALRFRAPAVVRAWEALLTPAAHLGDRPRSARGRR